MSKTSACRQTLLCVGAAVAAGFALAAPADAPAQTDTDLRKVEEQLQDNKDRKSALNQKAKTLKQELADLRGNLVTAARAVREHEETLDELSDRLQALRQDEANRRAALDRQRGQLVSLLSALQRIALQPPQALMAGRSSTIDTVRSAMLLNVAVPAMERRAIELREELIVLGELQDEIETRKREASVAADALESERRQIARLVDRKNQFYKKNSREREEVSRRLSRLTKQASSLRDLMDRIEEERKAAERRRRELGDQETVAEVETVERAERTAGRGYSSVKPDDFRPFPKRGAMFVTPPVRGTVVRKFNEKTETGAKSKGIEIAGRSDAQVVAPFDGQVVFSGPFRGYGQILIIEHGGGYHSLISGLGRLDASVGAWLAAGEPIGLLEPAGSGDPILYLELRRQGRPINPQPWLAMRNGKVTG